MWWRRPREQPGVGDLKIWILWYILDHGKPSSAGYLVRRKTQGGEEREIPSVSRDERDKDPPPPSSSPAAPATAAGARAAPSIFHAALPPHLHLAADSAALGPRAHWPPPRAPLVSPTPTPAAAAAAFPPARSPMRRPRPYMPRRLLATLPSLQLACVGIVGIGGGDGGKSRIELWREDTDTLTHTSQSYSTSLSQIIGKHGVRHRGGFKPIGRPKRRLSNLPNASISSISPFPCPCRGPIDLWGRPVRSQSSGHPDVAAHGPSRCRCSSPLRA